MVNVNLLKQMFNVCTLYSRNSLYQFILSKNKPYFYTNKHTQHTVGK